MKLGSVFFFFFSSRRRHTRSYGDWSSDVCSSDLHGEANRRLVGIDDPVPRPRLEQGLDMIGVGRPGAAQVLCLMRRSRTWATAPEIGRASCRERGKSSVAGGALKKEEKVYNRKRR